jgi:hypothetical protein
VVHRRNLLAADRRHRVLPSRRLLLHQSREVADEVPGLLLLEDEAAHVLRLVLQGDVREVDDREVHVRVFLPNGVDCVRHQEADADHQVVVLLGQRRQVRDVVGVRVRLEHLAGDAELILRALEPDVGEVVERLVVQAADVRDQPDLDRRASPAAARRSTGGSRRLGLLLAAAAAAGCEDGKAEGGNRHDRPTPQVLPQVILPLLPGSDAGPILKA